MTSINWLYIMGLFWLCSTVWTAVIFWRIGYKSGMDEAVSVEYKCLDMKPIWDAEINKARLYASFKIGGNND